MKAEDLTLEQCKALAYDELRKLETVQRNLQILNQRIQGLEKCQKKDEAVTTAG